MVDNSWLLVEGASLKHRAFLSFHISQATRAKRVSAPFLFSPCHLRRHCSQQVSREASPTCEASALRTARMVHHTCLENEQEAMMWSMVSGSWLQR